MKTGAGANNGCPTPRGIYMPSRFLENDVGAKYFPTGGKIIIGGNFWHSQISRKFLFQKMRISDGRAVCGVVKINPGFFCAARGNFYEPIRQFFFRMPSVKPSRRTVETDINR